MKKKSEPGSILKERQQNVTGLRHADAIDETAIEHPAVGHTSAAGSSLRATTSTHRQQTVRAFLDAVALWRLNESQAAQLAGVTPATVAKWKTGEAPTSEEVLARMVMVALIRTALEICFSPSLSAQWMTRPNRGEPYCGLAPVVYVAEHGWPGLFHVLRQTQAYAVGN